MNKIWIIIQREYLTRVKKKSFILTTLLLPLGGIALALMIGFLATSVKNNTKLKVVDETQMFSGTFDTLKNVTFDFTNETLETALQNYADEDYTGIIYVPSTFTIANAKGIKFYGKKQIGIGTKDKITTQFERQVYDRRLKDEGYDKNKIAEMKVNIAIDEEVGGTKKSAEMATGIGIGVGVLIFMFMTIYGTMVLKGVMEEKTNRISEVIISSVKPFQLMMGKIVGIGFVGLTQVMLWGILLSIGYTVLMIFFGDQLMAAQEAQANMAMGGSIDLENINPDMLEYAGMIDQLIAMPWAKILVCFVFFFLGGYVLYASLYAAVGGAIEDDAESQALIFPIMIPIFVSYMALIMSVDNLDNTLNKVLSFIPFTSPVMMTARAAFNVPWYQILISMLILMVGIVATVWVAARIYRVGILMYGKKVNLKELVKWARQN